MEGRIGNLGKFDVKKVMDTIEMIKSELKEGKLNTEKKLLAIGVVLGILTLYNIITFLVSVYDKIFCCGGSERRKSRCKKRKNRNRSKSSQQGSSDS